MEVATDHQPYTGAVMSIDPAGMGKDETGYAVVKILHSQLFLTDSGGFLGGYTPDVLKSLARVARLQKVNHIIVESNFGDGMFSQLLKPVLAEDVGYPVTVEEVRHSKQKERRIIDTLEPIMNSHKLIIDKSIIESDFRGRTSFATDQQEKTRGNLVGDGTLYQLFYQMSRITFDKGALRHDDRLDALAMAVGYWVEQMELHTDKSVATYRDELIDAELDKFVESHNKLWGKKEKITWM
jgi:hypothetical protein